MTKPYKCPRCGYATSNVGDMKRHLYLKKKICPALDNVVDLTEDIKDFIIQNRVYEINKTDEKVINTNTIINNFNNVNNYIAGMDILEKLDKYMKHTRFDLIGFEESVEKKYAKCVDKLENDSWKYGFEMNKDDLLDVIDQVSKISSVVSQDGKVKTFEDLNIYYDKDADKLKIFDGEWEEMLLNRGIKKILQTIQSYYWDAYECYLVKKIYKASNAFTKQHLKEFLLEYYKFIGCFDVEPFIKDKNDNEIVGDNDEEYTICDEYYPMYIKTRDNIKKSEINNVKKIVLDIIRKNSDRNVNELNKRVFDLFKIDETFKNSLVPTQ